jgi:hypothetical protein
LQGLPCLFRRSDNFSVQVTANAAEQGKTVYIALRWQNEKGEKGPWSEIEN